MAGDRDDTQWRHQQGDHGEEGDLEEQCQGDRHTDGDQPAQRRPVRRLEPPYLAYIFQ